MKKQPAKKTASKVSKTSRTAKVTAKTSPSIKAKELSLAILLSSVVILVGVIAYTQYQDNNKSLSTQQQQTRTYESADFGFSFAYPNQWGELKQIEGTRASKTPMALQTNGVTYSVGNAELTAAMSVIAVDKKAERSTPSPKIERTNNNGVAIKTTQHKTDGSVFGTIEFESQQYRVLINLPILTSSDQKISTGDLDKYQEIVRRIEDSIQVK